MKHEVVLQTKSVDETMALGQFLGKSAVDDEFIALSGDLGAGKTHFVQGLAAGMEISGVIGSPTFTIMNYYEGALPLKHFDFYRLHREEELYDIGWEEYSTGGVTVAEWADMFPDVVPPEAIHIDIRVLSETEREIRITWSDAAPDAIVKEITHYASSH